MTSVRVQSFSTPGKAWHVSMTTSGELTCTCPAFGFGRLKLSGCKHVEIVKTAQYFIDRCGQHRPFMADRRVCGQCIVDVIAAMTSKVRRSYKPKPVLGKRPRVSVVQVGVGWNLVDATGAKVRHRLYTSKGQAIAAARRRGFVVNR